MENPLANEVLRSLKNKSIEKNKWRRINHAKYVMFIIGAFSIVSAVTVWSFLQQDFMNSVLYFMLVFGAIYIGLGIWTTRNPKLAIGFAISIFIIFLVLSVMGNPESIYEGFLWKTIIFTLFVRGLLAANRLKTEIVDDELIDNF